MPPGSKETAWIYGDMGEDFNAPVERLRLDGHGQSGVLMSASGELRESGPVDVAMAPTFNRFLGVKARAQYQARATTAKGSRDAVAWAARMYEAARRMVAA